MKNQKDTKVNALVMIHELREDIAEFIAEHSDSVDQLIRRCEENAWNDFVAYELKDGMAKLGIVLASLMLWDRDVNVTQEEKDAIEKQIEDRKRG